MVTEIAATAGWVGEWFQPKVGVLYTVPQDAANHRDLAGSEGKCIKAFTNAHGHSWALLRFPNGYEARVRTCYLLPVGHRGQKLQQVDKPKAEHEPMEKVKNVWSGPSNSGTEQLRGY
jgi:hypothetical protein